MQDYSRLILNQPVWFFNQFLASLNLLNNNILLTLSLTQTAASACKASKFSSSQLSTLKRMTLKNCTPDHYPPGKKESVTDLCCSATTSTEELNKEFMDKRFIP